MRYDGDSEDHGGSGKDGRLNGARVRSHSARGTCSTNCTRCARSARRAQFRSAVIMLGCAVVLASLLACVGGFPARSAKLGVDLERRDALDDWIATQEPISYAGVLANIGDAGVRSYGAKRGLVLASPSTVDPDCK